MLCTLKISFKRKQVWLRWKIHDMDLFLALLVKTFYGECFILILFLIILFKEDLWRMDPWFLILDPCHGFIMGSWAALLFIKLELCKAVNQRLNSFINALLVISPPRTQTRLFVDTRKKIQSQLRYWLGFIIFNTWSRRRRSYQRLV